MKIAVIDGLGGGLGCQIIEDLKKELKDSIEITALGINSQATSNMVKAGAYRGATGENAIRITTKEMDVLVGPLGIIIAGAMMGEVTPGIAEIVMSSPAKKFLLCVKQPHVELIEVDDQPVAVLIKKLVARVREFIQGN
ncbi:MAG: DUF3842 family protein [Deltaproteobacteria bacterium]|nr:DUF3842 family protein [Deltaproteobacteria bacterium]